MININEIINRAYGRTIGALLWVVAVFFMLQGIASAQTELPPIIGDTLWTYETQNVDDKSPTNEFVVPMHALAKDAGLLFRISVTDVLVLDATDGSLKDRLGLATLLANPRARTWSIQCDRYGKHLVIRYKSRGRTSVEDSLVTMLVSYPERQVLKKVRYQGWVEYFYDYHSALSPDGRWMAAPYDPINGKSYLLHDSERDTSHIVNLGGTSLWSFDSSSTQAAFSNVIIDLQSGTPKVRSFPAAKGLSRPMFSADGRYIIGTTTTRAGLSQYPRVSVLDLTTGEITWQLHGSLQWTGGNGRMRDDLVSYAISGDGRLVYAYRNDTINGRGIDEGFFYRLPDTIPIARSKPRTTGGFVPGYIALSSDHAGCTVFTSDLTRCFVAAKFNTALAYPKMLVAMRFDELVTGIPEGGPTNPEQPALYPNPTTGSVTLPWQWPDDLVHWQLLTTSGQMVTFGSSHVTLGNVSIDLSQELASGRYALLVRDASASHVVHQTVIKY